jgi:DNA-binding GntR family transcriptional regulator
MAKKTAKSAAHVRDWTPKVLDLWRRQGTGLSTSEAIYATLRKAIVEGALPAGERLGENQLAAVFRRSRTPIREAILRLESERLVEHLPRKGLVVASISREEILQIYAVRVELDALSARLAAEGIPATELDHLVWLNDRVRHSAEQKDYDNVLNLSLEFHEAVCRAGRNALLLHFMQQIHDRVRRFQKTTLSYPGRSHEAVEEHDALLDAIRRRDPEAAERIARGHIVRAMQLRIAMQQSSSTTVRHGTPPAETAERLPGFGGEV